MYRTVLCVMWIKIELLRLEPFLYRIRKGLVYYKLLSTQGLSTSTIFCLCGQSEVIHPPADKYLNRVASTYICIIQDGIIQDGFFQLSRFLQMLLLAYGACEQRDQNEML